MPRSDLMLALRIALRYLLAPKSHNAVNVISVISMTGVAVAVAAIVVVLSVFNGFADLAAAHLSVIDPELKVVPRSGKVFAGADTLAAELMRDIPDLAVATPSLEERALLVARSGQMPVVFKGVDPDVYPLAVDFNSTILDGSPLFNDSIYGLVPMTISVGVAMETGLRPGQDAGAELYVPRRKGRINPANPAASYRSAAFAVAGVYRVEQPEYDTDRLLIPLDKARTLLEYGGGEASALELRLSPGSDVEKVRSDLEKRLGGDFEILSRLQQQEAAFRMIAIEKWMTFVMLAAILLIACFNIFSTLSLLVIEKRSDASTLRALGASRGQTSLIFSLEGALITLAGGLAGLLLGSLLTLGQQTWGWVKLAGDPSLLTTSSYPVRLAPWPDLAAVMLMLVIMASITALAARFFTRKM